MEYLNKGKNRSRRTKGHLEVLLSCSGGSLEGVLLADLGFAVAAEQCECTECNGAVTD